MVEELRWLNVMDNCLGLRFGFAYPTYLYGIHSSL